MQKRAELLKLETIEDLIEYQDYIMEDTILNEHFRTINFLNTDEEQRNRYF